MPKLKKYPKRPKKSSSLAVWERYHERCAEIKKENARIEADKKKKETLIAKRIS